MLFFLSKATKQKSATMVQTILYVWLVLSFRVMERQFTEFRFLSGQYQKKKKKKRDYRNKYKHQTPTYISEKIS